MFFLVVCVFLVPLDLLNSTNSCFFLFYSSSCRFPFVLPRSWFFLFLSFDRNFRRCSSGGDQGPRDKVAFAISPAVLTRQCDFSGDFDSRATDRRAASRSQNVRFINLAGSRSGCCGDSCGRTSGC